MASGFRNYRMVPNEDPTRHSGLVLRNIKVRGRRTSIRLEPEIWEALAEICRREYCTRHEVCGYVASLKRGSLTSSLRVFMLDYFRASATESGHKRAAHGKGMFILKRQERRHRREANRRASDGLKRGAQVVRRSDHR
jgi:predicted DNA-binding ribbon-helix-helix protein